MAVYKRKGDPPVCGSHRANKLLEQPMKVLVRVLVKYDHVSIDDRQFGYIHGKGTTDAIFNHATNSVEAPSKLYYVFVDLEGDGEMGFEEAGYG